VKGSLSAGNDFDIKYLGFKGSTVCESGEALHLGSVQCL
jgi:hypothetical protein